MEKPNFQRETEKAIERLCVVSRPPLLLHACCAPCSSYVLEYLTQYFSITLFFCIPISLTQRNTKSGWRSCGASAPRRPFAGM